MWLWKALAEKGKIATILGALVGAPGVIWLYYRLFTDHGISDSEMRTVVMIFSVSIIYFILPSKFTARFGSAGEISVED